MTQAIDQLLAHFPIVKTWYEQNYAYDRSVTPRRKAAALMVLHHGRGSPFTLEAMAKSVGTTPGTVRVWRTQPPFINEMHEEAEGFASWLLHVFSWKKGLSAHAEELRRTITHLGNHAVKALYDWLVLGHEFHDPERPGDRALLTEMAAFCASRAWGIPMSEDLQAGVARVMAKPPDERLGVLGELRDAILQERQRSTKALQAEVRELSKENIRLQQALQDAQARRRQTEDAGAQRTSELPHTRILEDVHTILSGWREEPYPDTYTALLRSALTRVEQGEEELAAWSATEHESIQQRYEAARAALAGAKQELKERIANWSGAMAMVRDVKKWGRE